MRLKTMLIAAAGVILVIVVGTVVALRSLDFNKYKGLVVGQVKAATGRELKIGGNLGLAIGFSPAVVVEDVSFANAPWGSRPDMVKMHRFEVEVALIPLIFRDIRVKRLVLVEPDILLETDAKGNGNWSLGDAAARPAPRAAKPAETRAGLAAIAVEKVRIEKGSLTYRDGRTKRATSLALDRLDLRAKDVTSPLTIDFAGAYAGKAFTLAGTVGPLSELQALSRPYPVKLALKAAGAAIEVEGTIAKPMEATGLDLFLSAKGQDIAEVARLAGKAVPAVGPFSVTAKVTGSPQALSASGISASLGKSTLTGEGAVSVGGPRPRLRARLASSLLDLAELFPQAGSARTGAATPGKAPEPAKDKRLFPADPLPFDPLKRADADVELKVDRLVLPDKLPIDALALRLVLAGGRLEVQPLSSRVGGGAVGGRVTLDMSAGTAASLAAKLDAKAVDLGQVLQAMGRPDLVTGVRTDLSLDLKGGGGSVRDLMAGLNGDLVLVLGEGKVHSSFIDWLGADLLTQIAEKLNPLAKKDPYTDLRCGVIRFAARAGVATSDRTIAFETSKMTVVSSGTANLKSEAIDFSLRPGTRQVVGIGAGELVKLLRVRGTLAEPKIGVDELGVGKTVLSIGAAVATGGLSFLAETLVKKATADAHPCQTALSQPAAPAKTGAPPSTAAPSGQEAPKTGGGIERFFQGLFGK